MPDSVCTSFLADTPPKQALSTLFAPPQVNDTDATEPHIRPKVYIGDALPEEPSGIVTARPELTTARAKHGDAWCSHGTFLHAAVHMEPFSKRLCALQPIELHYMSRDHPVHPKAHELTNHILHPSPAPGLRSPGAQGNVLRRWCWPGIVPVLPTGTTGGYFGRE